MLCRSQSRRGASAVRQGGSNLQKGARDNAGNVCHPYLVKHLRRILSDRLNGGLLAALLAYALLFQSVAGSFAAAQMAGMQAAGIDCTAHDPRHMSREKNASHECCGTLCQAMCGAGLQLSAVDHSLYVGPLQRDTAAAGPACPTAPWPSQRGGLCGEARAPPASA